MKLLFRLVILSVCFLCVGKVYAENVSNLSYMITNREVWKISEIKRKIDSNKISYIPEINLLSFHNLDNEDQNIISKYFDLKKGNSLPKIDIQKEIEVDTISNSQTESIHNDSVSNSIYGKTDILSEEYNSFNWPYKKILSDRILNGDIRGEGIKVGIIDSGVDFSHPNLVDNNLKQKNYVNDDQTDELGHGTQVAGVIDTLAPGVEMTSYKVMGAEEGESLNVIRAIIDATNDGMDIINVSLGSYKNYTKGEEKFTTIAFLKAIEYARRNKTIIVASAGNESINLDTFSNNSLKFEVQANSILGYEIWWQVTNTGREAELANSLRGGFYNSELVEGKRVRKESTLYTGRHYVEAYLVKNGICYGKSIPFEIIITDKFSIDFAH